MISLYRCPGCMRTSCSLACVNAHKAHYSCSGVRNRAAPVPKRDYSESHFMSDYCLLEDARRAVDAANAVRPRNYKDHRAPKKTEYPDAIPRRRMELLAREAAKRGIDLRFMPSMFLRHRRNSSNVRTVVLKEDGTGEERPFEKTMIWSMEVVFWGRGGGTRNVKISDVDEDTPMKDILAGAVASLKIKKDRLSGKEDPYIDFLDVPAENICAFLKNEVGLIKRLADAPIQLPDVYLRTAKRRKMADGVHVETYDMEYDTKKFNEVETATTIRESLYGRSIVEYPIVHIVVKGSEEEMQIRNQLRGIFERPEPSASDASHSEDEREYEPEEGELQDNEEDDTPMPDASQEGDKIGSSGKAPAVITGDSSKPHIEEKTAESKDENSNHEKKAEPDAMKDVVKDMEGGDAKKPPLVQTSDTSDAKAMAPSEDKDADPVPAADDRTSQERETTANVSSSSLQDLEPLPNGHFVNTQEGEVDKTREFSPIRRSRGGKEPVRKLQQNDFKSNDDYSDDNSESETESQVERPSVAEKRPPQPDRLSRPGKRKSRFSDLQPGDKVEEEFPATKEETLPAAKRQKPAHMDTEDKDITVDEKSTDPASNEGKGDPKDDKSSEKSPPLPFAFEYDSALLSDRIPRRKKIANSGGLQTLKSY